MLVLSRRKNESVTLDGQIVVTILEVKGGVVRIGINAPRSVSIVRTELIGTPKGESPNEEEHATRTNEMAQVLREI